MRVISDPLLVYYLWITVCAYGYMITESGDKTGKNGHKTTWYVMRGDKIAIPCHYKAPEDSANEDSASYVWKIPPHVRSRYHPNEDNQLVVEDIQMLDSTTLMCRSYGVSHQHTVLVIEEPIWANVSRAMRFTSAGSCLHDTPTKSKLLQTIIDDLCSNKQLTVIAKTDKGEERKCRVRVSSQCTKSPNGPRFYFDIKISIDVPNFETCDGPRVKPNCVNYENVAQRLCVPHQKCHLDFMCHQNFSCIEDTQYGVYKDVIEFAYSRLGNLVEDLMKKSSRLLYGLTLKLKAPNPVEITGKCAHPGHKLISHVICMPCIPHTYLEDTDGPTAAKCKTCENASPPDRYGTSDCERSPQNPGPTKYRTWPKWMRIPRYLKFTTPLPSPPTTPPTEATVSQQTTVAKVAQVTEAPDDSSNSRKALGIVVLCVILLVVFVIMFVQGRKYKEKFYSRYQQIREEERIARSEEMKLLKEAKSRNKRKRSQSNRTTPNRDRTKSRSTPSKLDRTNSR